MPFEKDLMAELHSMVSNFISHEQQGLSEPAIEFHDLLKKTLTEVINSLFTGEIQKITEIKEEIGFISEKIVQKQEELTDKMAEFLLDLPEISEECGLEFKELMQTVHSTVMEMSERNRECEVIMKTVKKINEKKKTSKTPKQQGNTGFFSQRPRAANILFMEERINEMFPQGATPEDYKNNLKSLLNEWKELESEKRLEFEKKAEQELLECYVS